MEKVKTTERGWASHFICANRCTFHRSTLIEYKGVQIVVSSVGAFLAHPLTDSKPTTIGCERYYETMVWFADDTEFKDANVEKGELDFACPEVPIPWDEINANNIHDNMVEKWKKEIKNYARKNKQRNPHRKDDRDA